MESTLLFPGMHIYDPYSETVVNGRPSSYQKLPFLSHRKDSFSNIFLIDQKKAEETTKRETGQPQNSEWID